MNPDTTAKLLTSDYYQNEDVVLMARDLLGKVIVTHTPDGTCSAIIVETEAYRGPDDRGCHAFGGRYTERTKTMYMPGGTAYVYTCYGVHPMMNVVTGLQGQAHAVLIRGVEPVDGKELMEVRRKMTGSHSLTSGPGKLTIAMGITRDMDGISLVENNASIQILDTGITIPESEIESGPRIGMSIHVGSCSHRPWRFYIRGNPWVSKPLKVDYTGKW